MKKVIILHGWTKTLDKWQPLLDALKTKGVNADLPKIPGLTGNLNEVWKLSDYVQWLKNITDKEKDKVVLIGHSNGGKIALAFTNKYPEKVEKLILINSSGIYHDELLLKIKRTIFKTLAKVGKRLTSSKLMKNLLYKLARESDYKDLDNKARQTMINLLNSDKNLNISQISVPTLIIWGENDKTTPLSDGLLMNSLIKNSKMKIIKDARHSPQFTHPNEVADLIVNNLTI